MIKYETIAGDSLKNSTVCSAQRDNVASPLPISLCKRSTYIVERRTYDYNQISSVIDAQLPPELAALRLD